MKRHIKLFEEFSMKEDDAPENIAAPSQTDQQDSLSAAVKNATDPSTLKTVRDAYAASPGADVNGLDSQGKTPLIVAIETGYHGVVELLLSMGANPNKTGKAMGHEMRPLELALLLADRPSSAMKSEPGKGMGKIVEILQQAGAK